MSCACKLQCSVHALPCNAVCSRNATSSCQCIFQAEIKALEEQAARLAAPPPKARGDLLDKQAFLRAAFDLQSRISLQVNSSFLNKEREKPDKSAWPYARTSTVRPRGAWACLSIAAAA